MATSAAYIDLDEGAAPSTPAAGKVRIYAKTDGDAYQKDDAGAETSLASGGGGSVTSDEAFLTSNVSMASADTYYDGPSLSLAAGTWLVWASLVVSASGAATHIQGKLWDGTNVYHNAEVYSGTAGSTVTLTLFGEVVLGGTTTVKASAARDVGSGGTILDQAQVNGTADKASKITAIQLS